MIAIPNMEKPKSCYLCTFRIIDPTDGSVCGCVVGHIQGIPLDQDRADDCPLIEIVRCGECTRRKKNGFCLEHNRYERNDDGFCSYGERRADENIENQ